MADEAMFTPLPRGEKKRTELLKTIGMQVDAAHEDFRVRPTAAAVVYHAQTCEYLLITSTNGGYFNPGLVKGGIKPGERVVTSLLREIREELRIPRKRLALKAYGGAHDVESIHGKEGCKIKRYFVFLVSYRGPRKLNINGELSGYYWKQLDQVPDMLAVLWKERREKYKLLSRIFGDPSLPYILR